MTQPPAAPSAAGRSLSKHDCFLDLPHVSKMTQQKETSLLTSQQSQHAFFPDALELFFQLVSRNLRYWSLGPHFTRLRTTFHASSALHVSQTAEESFESGVPSRTPKCSPRGVLSANFQKKKKINSTPGQSF